MVMNQLLAYSCMFLKVSQNGEGVTTTIEVWLQSTSHELQCDFLFCLFFCIVDLNALEMKPLFVKYFYDYISNHCKLMKNIKHVIVSSK